MWHDMHVRVIDAAAGGTSGAGGTMFESNGRAVDPFDHRCCFGHDSVALSPKLRRHYAQVEKVSTWQD